MKKSALLAALSLVVGLAGPIGADLVQPDPTGPAVVKMSADPNPPVAGTDASYTYRVTCNPMAGYSYRSSLTMSVTTYNGVSYITALNLYTTYPKGGYTDVTWGGKVGRVHTNGGAVGSSYFSGWKAAAGSRFTARQALSLPLAPDPSCTISGPMPRS